MTSNFGYLKPNATFVKAGRQWETEDTFNVPLTKPRLARDICINNDLVLKAHHTNDEYR
jgi:hypothetical protein